MDLRAEQAWEQAEGSVIKPPLVRLMPGRPKRNRRKERQELEVRPARNGSGTVIGRKGVVMHCRNCGLRGHNARCCPDNEVATSSMPRRSRRTQGADADHERAKRRMQCSKCRDPGHNTRTCPMLKGLQAVVDLNTSTRVRENEIRTVMQGVGVYTNELTGNSYYRAGLGPIGPDIGAADEIANQASQPVPPFATQPTEGEM